VIDSDYTVEAANWEADQAALKLVRERVFIREQSVPVEDEWDALDARSFHLLARDSAGHPIGTARLTPDHAIGRLAVVSDWRGRRVGSTLLQRLLEQAQAQAWSDVTLNAQTTAIPFYQRAGFVAEGPEFYDAGIPHRRMRKKLEPPAVPERKGPAPPADADSLRAESMAEARDCIDQVAAGARHRICIYTSNLEPSLHEREPLLGEIKRVALSGRGAAVRILVRNPEELSRDRHPLLHLAHRLPSFIVFRSPLSDEDRLYPSAFVVNDAGGYFFRILAGRPEGEGSTRTPGRQCELQAYFDSVWLRSETDPEFRRQPV
jgi:predicted GNAT family N-acyltransferase